VRTLMSERHREYRWSPDRTGSPRASTCEMHTRSRPQPLGVCRGLSPRCAGIETEYGVGPEGERRTANPVAASSAAHQEYVSSTTRSAGTARKSHRARRTRWCHPLRRRDLPRSRHTSGNHGAGPKRRAVLRRIRRHPESDSTPECLHALDIVKGRQGRRRRRVLARSTMQAAAPPPPSRGQEVVVYKTTPTERANTLRTPRRNYLIRTARAVLRLVRTSMPGSSPDRVHRCRQGRLRERGYGGRLPQSASEPTIRGGVGSRPTLKRPIVNTRDEPTTAPSCTTRLHVIAGDATCVEVETVTGGREPNRDRPLDRSGRTSSTAVARRGTRTYVWRRPCPRSCRVPRPDVSHDDRGWPRRAT